ncbi:MAG: DUF1059 domain-containing protein [Anaerolineae bacterium]
MPKYGLTCGSCGQKITGETHEEVLEKTREHNKKMHQAETDEQEAREKIKPIDE